jgi:hypothetical protein
MTSEHIIRAPQGVVTPQWAVLPNTADEKVGYDLTLICRACGDRRLVAARPDGEFPSGFWLCPRGCDR